MEVLERYLKYNGELVGLDRERGSGGTDVVKLARNIITMRYDQLYGIQRN